MQLERPIGAGLHLVYRDPIFRDRHAEPVGIAREANRAGSGEGVPIALYRAGVRRADLPARLRAQRRKCDHADVLKLPGTIVVASDDPHHEDVPGMGAGRALADQHSLHVPPIAAWKIRVKVQYAKGDVPWPQDVAGVQCRGVRQHRRVTATLTLDVLAHLLVPDRNEPSYGVFGQICRRVGAARMRRPRRASRQHDEKQQNKSVGEAPHERSTTRPSLPPLLRPADLTGVGWHRPKPAALPFAPAGSAGPRPMPR